MTTLSSSRCTLSVFVAVWLAGCGSQATVGSPGLTAPGDAVNTLGANRAPMRRSAKSCPTAACIYVANEAGAGSVTVYPANASGDVSPFRTITGLTNPGGVAVDSKGEVYVSFSECFVSKCIPAPAILVFSATAHGHAKPLYRITGPATRLQSSSAVALDATGNVYVRNSHVIVKDCGLSGCLKRGFVTVYGAGSHGNAAPARAIRGRKTGMFNQGGDVAVDNQGNAYVTTVPSCWGSRCKGKAEILVFEPGVSGDSKPSWTIGGSAAGLSYPAGVAVDDAGNVYVADLLSASVFVYATGAHGNVAPVQTISGSNTGLNVPISVAVDPEHNIYVVNAGSTIYAASVTVYAAGATGNVAPIQTITGGNTGFSLPVKIAVH